MMDLRWLPPSVTEQMRQTASQQGVAAMNEELRRLAALQLSPEIAEALRRYAENRALPDTIHRDTISRLLQHDNSQRMQEDADEDDCES